MIYMEVIEETNTVVTSVGTFVLKKPKAGLRNKHMEASETAQGVKLTTFMMKLLPDCVMEHPFEKNIVVRDELNNLWPEDYDLLIEGMRPLLGKVLGSDVEKKLETPSGPQGSQPTDGSKTSS
ncbi:hypothetical protein LCGC14_1635140 [marine sediment metagenome]|uniref:Uncharacterized protein n=1 Tax=marine sediment metagenome TaxID=412755 RepID=A0A0F9INN4_9ZZZZ